MTSKRFHILANQYIVYEIIKTIKKSYATYIDLLKLSYGKGLLLSNRGSINVGLLGENDHNIDLIVGEDLLLNEVVVPLVWITSYTIFLSRQIHA